MLTTSLHCIFLYDQLTSNSTAMRGAAKNVVPMTAQEISVTAGLMMIRIPAIGSVLSCDRTHSELHVQATGSVVGGKPS